MSKSFTPYAGESYLVIGGGTSLGEAIVNQLLSRGERQVSIFDAQPLAAEQAERFTGKVHTFIGDILVPESLSKAIKEVSYPLNPSITAHTHGMIYECSATCIIHTGMVSTPGTAEALYPTSSSQPLTTREAEAKTLEVLTEFTAIQKRVNTEGTRSVLSAILANGVAKLVYIGNADIVFDGTDRPMLTEAAAAYPPKCWYSDLEPASYGERLVLSSTGIDGLATVVLRPAMVFG